MLAPGVTYLVVIGMAWIPDFRVAV